jgi:hypothetical protein
MGAETKNERDGAVQDQFIELEWFIETAKLMDSCAVRKKSIFKSPLKLRNGNHSASEYLQKFTIEVGRGSCESGNELPGSIKCWEITEWLHNFWPLEWCSAPQNYLVS